MKRKALAVAVVALLCVWVLALNLGTLLAAPADKPEPADLIVVLGGDSGSRSVMGARLYRQGVSPRVLLTGLEHGALEAMPHYLHWRSQLLQSLGVDSDGILFDTVSANSWQEAENTLRLLRNNGWRTVIVVSDPPHMRRLDWIWGKVFDGTERNYRLVASQPDWWDGSRWWANEMSAKFVANELIKLVYYPFKYGI